MSIHGRWLFAGVGENGAVNLRRQNSTQEHQVKGRGLNARAEIEDV
jgi:hypothetical protein